MHKSQTELYTFKGISPEPTRTFRYGKLTKSSYASRNLWFIELLSTPYGGKPITCLVDEAYAKPHVFEEYKADLTLWENIAYQVMDHPWGWDYFNECMWVESPVDRFTLPDGKVLRYGYSRTQSDVHPERELWYMSMLAGHAVIIDRECLEPGFILKMYNAKYIGREPSFWWRWVSIAWCHVISEGIGEDDNWRRVNSFAPRPLDLVSGNDTPNIYSIIGQDKSD